MLSLRNATLISTNSQCSPNMRLQFAPYNLIFKRPAQTSRATMTDKITCFLRIFDESEPEHFGIGEAAVFPGLSPEADERFFYKLMELQANIRLGQSTDLSSFPSLQSGLEQAIRDYAGGCRGIYFNSPFIHGKETIPINGLIWMGTFDYMQQQIDEKIAQGFRCLKLKIGAIDWKQEISLIQSIRKQYDSTTLQIRVDANGAFSPVDALDKLEELSKYEIHSIEQPIATGFPDEMARLCRQSPLPIALDEELIGLFNLEDKRKIIDHIRPQYIILKPALIGGYTGAEEWISLADEREIGWWVTSALESNIGLNALSQWVATLNHDKCQGLGTGNLYLNNLSSPIYLKGDLLGYNPTQTLDRKQLDSLSWRE